MPAAATYARYGSTANELLKNQLKNASDKLRALPHREKEKEQCRAYVKRAFHGNRNLGDFNKPMHFVIGLFIYLNYY